MEPYRIEEIKTRQRKKEKKGAGEVSLTDCSRYKQQPNYKLRCCSVRERTQYSGVMRCETTAYIQYRILNGVLGSSYEDYIIQFLQLVMFAG